MIECLGDLDC